MNPRVLLAGLGLVLIILGSVPVMLLWLAISVGGGWGLLAGIAAVLTGPMLALWLFGPKLVMLAVRGVPTVQFGRFTVGEEPSAPEDVVEGRFE